jgi:uncharacterized protein (TIGR02001 family)
MQKNLKAAILAALMLAPTVSFAQEAEESNLSAHFGIVSDYVFRGVSQSNREVALQAGFDYAFGDSGLYAGVWGSTVDFAAGSDGPNVEIDTYIGYGVDLGEKFNLDVMLTRYNYFGDENGYGSINYNELITKFSMKDVATLTVGYTNDYSGLGEEVTYVNLGHAWDLGNDYTLNAGFGRSFADAGDYNDWNVGVAKSFGAIEVSLNYFDTNLPFRASDSVVLGFKIGG